MARNKVKDPNKLSFGRLLAFKSSDIVSAWINLIMLNYLSIYASDTLGVNLLTVSTLLLVSKAVDAVTDMVAGVIVDNTHTKLGKGRPYELCIIGMTICTILLFAGNPEWSNVVKCAWIFCMYTLTFSIFATMRNAAMNPYTIRTFSNNPALLKKVSSYGGIITMAGSIVMSTLFPVLMSKMATSAAGWTRMVAIVMIPASVLALGRFIFCKEDPAVDAESKQEPIRFKELGELLRRNKYVWLYGLIMLCHNIMTNLAIGAYYFKWVVGNIGVQGLMSVVSFACNYEKNGFNGKNDLYVQHHRRCWLCYRVLLRLLATRCTRRLCAGAVGHTAHFLLRRSVHHEHLYLQRDAGHAPHGWFFCYTWQFCF